MLECRDFRLRVQREAVQECRGVKVILSNDPRAACDHIEREGLHKTQLL